jgi:hypothetical protein
LNSSNDQLAFIKLFNERTKIILIEDENGGFKLVDTFLIAQKALQCNDVQNCVYNSSEPSHRILTDCNDPIVSDIIVPAVRDEILTLILDNLTNPSTPPQVTSQTPPFRATTTLPCVTNVPQFVKYASEGHANWPLNNLIACSAQITAQAHNLTAKYPVYQPRVPVPGEWPPVVNLAVVFSQATPEYTIVTPMFNVEVTFSIDFEDFSHSNRTLGSCSQEFVRHFEDHHGYLGSGYSTGYLCGRHLESGVRRAVEDPSHQKSHRPACGNVRAVVQ